MTGTCGWFLAFLFFLGAECICRCLVSLWFVLGAFAAFVCAVMGMEAEEQLLVFLLSSLAAFLLIRPIAFLGRSPGKFFANRGFFHKNRKEGEQPWN